MRRPGADGRGSPGRGPGEREPGPAGFWSWAARESCAAWTAWIYADTVDQRQVLAAAAAALAEADDVDSSDGVTRAVRRGGGSPATLLAAAETKPSAQDFEAPDAAIGGGRVVARPPERPEVGLRAAPARGGGMGGGGGGRRAGLFLVGRRFATVDLPFLEVLASVAGQAVARLAAVARAGPRRSEVPLARETPSVRDTPKERRKTVNPRTPSRRSPRLSARRVR